MKLLKADEDGIKIAAATIRDGGVVVYPTETVYGLGCLPNDINSTRRVCEIKGRTDKPLPLISYDLDAAKSIVEFNPTAIRLVEEFWPGPLTLVLPKKIDYPIWVTQGSKTLGIRVSSHYIARKLAESSGGVIVSTSANRSGEPPIRKAQEALDLIGNEVDLILDGGPLEESAPSTIIGVSGSEVYLYRKGPITIKQIKRILND